MSAIRTMCPHCISPVELEPAEVLLTAPPSSAGTGSYAYYCPACERVTVAPASPAAIELLVAAGVRVEGRRRRQPAPRFTLDDLLTFHQLLNTRDWFALLEG